MKSPRKKCGLIWKVSMSIIGLFVAYVVLGGAWVMYAINVPYLRDRDLFSYIGVPYDKQSVLYTYSTNSDYGLAFARISPTQAKAVLAGSSAIFPECNKKVDYDYKMRCTETWVPTTQLMPQMSSGETDKKQLQTMDDLYQKTITKDTLCTFSPNPILDPSVVINDRLCVNPVNGYVMYVYLNP